jgi:hypothetical protein
MNYKDIQWAKTETVRGSPHRLLRLTQGIWKENQGHGFGIDPGVNFGMSIIKDEDVKVYHGTFEKENEPGHYGLHAQNEMMGWLGFNFDCTCIIEGAAYHKTFGQVGLEEVRIGFYLGAVACGAFTVVKIVPPATIRKRVFDNHLQQAMDIFPLLHHNGADALSMAIYSLEIHNDRRG